MLRNGVIFKVAIILFGFSSMCVHSMTKEDFIGELHEACTGKDKDNKKNNNKHKNNNKNSVKKLLQQLNNHHYANEVKNYDVIKRQKPEKNDDLGKQEPKKEDTNQSESVNNGALHIICETLNSNPQDDCERYSAKRILAHLLYNDFNPNIQDENGNTPLHILKPLSINVRILKLLLDYGANPHIKNNTIERATA